MNNTRTIKTLFWAAGLCLAVSQARATSLAPGATISNPGSLPTIQVPTAPSTAVSSTGSASLLEEGASWKSGGRTGANTTFANGVWIDPKTGDLDFFYQIQNTFKGTATDADTESKVITLSDFTGIGITNVYQITLGAGGSGCAFFGSGTCPPVTNGSGFLRPTTGTVSSVARSLDGSDLTVTFSTGIAPGVNSAILVLQTNAKDFDQSGLAGFKWKGAPPVSSTGSGPGQNTAGVWQLDTLEPVLTPEPSAYAALSLGIIGLLFAVKRRSTKAQSKTGVANA